MFKSNKKAIKSTKTIHPVELHHDKLVCVMTDSKMFIMLKEKTDSMNQALLARSTFFGRLPTDSDTQKHGDYESAELFSFKNSKTMEYLKAKEEKALCISCPVIDWDGKETGDVAEFKVALNGSSVVTQTKNALGSGALIVEFNGKHSLTKEKYVSRVDKAIKKADKIKRKVVVKEQSLD